MRDSQLWLATGSYDLPVNQEENSAHVLNLYSKMAVIERNFNFKHLAYNQKRPLLRGTLMWNEYTHHEGINGSAKNIRIYSEKNDIEIEGILKTVNIYSTNNIDIKDSDLRVIGDTKSVNVLAKGESMIQRSSLSSISSFDAENIRSEGLYIDDSQLYVKGFSSKNLISEGGHILSYGSNLTNEGSNCVGSDAYNFSEHVGIEGHALHLFYVDTSKIVMKAEACPLSSYSMTTGIDESYYYGKSGGPLEIIDSEISIKTYGYVTAVRNDASLIKISNSKIEAQSLNFDAVGIDSFDTIFFKFNQSVIHIFAPKRAVLSERDLKVENNSESLSQCQINNEEPMVC